LPSSLARQIEKDGQAAYPNEGCGALLGRDVGDRRLVERLEPLGNAFAESQQHHRFSIAPLELMRVEKAAALEGRMVLGFYHSHPDAPARPSEYDREHAWEYYSYVIVSIARGRAVDMTSWVLDGQTRRFERQEIQEQGAGGKESQ
jgi:proteasome lid subunit RPN8/RPN11